MDGGEGWGVADEGDVVGEEVEGEGGPKGGEERSVNEEGFEGVAGCWVVEL